MHETCFWPMWLFYVVLPQTSQAENRSVIMWWDKLRFSVKPLSQTWQGNGFSPVWVLEFLSRSDLFIKLFHRFEKCPRFVLFHVFIPTRFWRKRFLTRLTENRPSGCVNRHVAVQLDVLNEAVAAGSAGLSFVCSMTCRIRLGLEPKLWSQDGHLKGLSPVWVLRCTVKKAFLLNAFPQVLQEKGRSSEWVAICLLKTPFRVKLLPQMVQGNGFSPVWMLTCLRTADLLLKSFPQDRHCKASHLCGFWYVKPNYT